VTPRNRKGEATGNTNFDLNRRASLRPYRGEVTNRVLLGCKSPWPPWHPHRRRAVATTWVASKLGGLKIIEWASRNVRHGEIVIPSRNRKSGNGNPFTYSRARSTSIPTAKRARKAETPKQPSLCLRLRAPYLYPDQRRPRLSAVARQEKLVAACIELVK
jgi:hypothetical protein